MKWLAFAVSALLGLVVLVAIVGWTLPVEHQASRTAALRVPPSRVQSIITDVERYPTWRPSVQRVERLPASGGATRFREVSGGDAITYEMAVVEPERRIVSRIVDESLPFGGSWTYDLLMGKDGTQLRITEEGSVSNPFFRFASRYIFGHTSTMETFLRDLGRHVGHEVTILE